MTSPYLDRPLRSIEEALRDRAEHRVEADPPPEPVAEAALPRNDSLLQINDILTDDPPLALLPGDSGTWAHASEAVEPGGYFVIRLHEFDLAALLHPVPVS